MNPRLQIRIQFVRQVCNTTTPPLNKALTGIALIHLPKVSGDKSPLSQQIPPGLKNGSALHGWYEILVSFLFFKYNICKIQRFLERRLVLKVIYSQLSGCLYSHAGVTLHLFHHFWPKYGSENWSRKNIFEIPPCTRPFSDPLIQFIKRRIFLQNYKFSNVNNLIWA